jgi:hypothetical protein
MLKKENVIRDPVAIFYEAGPNLIVMFVAAFSGVALRRNSEV